MKNYDLILETVATASLKPYGNNPRAHSKQQIAKLAAGIREFGFTNPILADEDSVVIAGHGRLAAALSLELQTIPVYRVTHLNEVQKKALRIADNRLGETSTWSDDLLAIELEMIIKSDFDVEYTAFDVIDVDRIVTPKRPPPEDAPLEPPPTRPVSRTGDMWALGSHRIVCGDSTEPATYLLVLANKLADMVTADLPYNVPVQGHVSGLGRKIHDEFAMASGEMAEAEFAAFMKKVLGLCRGASRDGSLHYYFMDWRSIGSLVLVGRQLFSELKNIIAWVKSNGAMGSLYRSQHELIAVFKHGKAKHVNNIQLGRMGRYRSNVWQYPGASGFSKSRAEDLADHPTVKPVQLVADAIRDATKPGDIVLDPFGGAGTTLLAAEQVGRHARLIEIEPKYVDVTLRRFEEVTGVEPALLPEGIPLSVIREARLAEEVA